jgi:hypothetical protein
MFVDVALEALVGQVLSVTVALVIADGVYGITDISVPLTGVTATAVGYSVLTGAR